MMNSHGDNNQCCYFHPKEFIVGVCALCLKERLLILASKQGSLPLISNKEHHRYFRVFRRKPTISFSKVFAFGSFLHLLEFRQPAKPGEEEPDAAESIASLEDSFISIKFEDSGKASWNYKNEGSLEPCSKPIAGGAPAEEAKGGKSVVERSKLWGTVRWRKRIGHLLQLSRWKRSNKAGSCHVGFGSKVERVKGRRGWMRA